ncbi:CGNR zinc finger domain-containing protein [Pseudonocardia sp. CA-107938]|uniref:CGNR zinc finger domain-containing protein n=1 Tax=Pseudonocardia sp. CA-107938 TaxID=3240021 RepID=UPI003D922DF3
MLPELIDAGHPALDLLNTAGGATRERDVERLTSFAEAVAFAARSGLVDAAEAAGLAGLDSPAEVVELRAQREALHGYLSALVDGRPPAPADRSRVERDVRAAYRAARLSGSLAGPAWIVEVGPGLIGHRFALATAALLSGSSREQISRCGRCSWFFLDPSPSRRRRWCSMATCGNRAKAARHHSRSR